MHHTAVSDNADIGMLSVLVNRQLRCALCSGGDCVSPWSRLLIDILVVAHLMKKLPTSCGTRRIVLLFARTPLVVFLPALVGIVG